MQLLVNRRVDRLDWANRSFANIKLENYGYAIRDADQSISIDPSYLKAYYRRASANMAINKFREALRDMRTVKVILLQVVKYAPHDKDAREKLEKVEAIQKRLDFEKALSYDEKSVFDGLPSIEQMILDKDYKGATWEGEDAPLTLEFVQDMIQLFLDQKKLPRKYAYKLLLRVKKHCEQMQSLVDVQVPKVMILFIRLGTRRKIDNLWRRAWSIS